MLVLFSSEMGWDGLDWDKFFFDSSTDLPVGGRFVLRLFTVWVWRMGAYEK